MRFAVRGRPDADAADIYIKALVLLLDRLQGQKHELAERDLAAVTRLVYAVEAMLLFVLP